jgi:uncharacterized membrane protein
VGHSNRMTTDYQVVAFQLMEQIASMNLSKAEALQLRTRLPDLRFQHMLQLRLLARLVALKGGAQWGARARRARSTSV